MCLTCLPCFGASAVGAYKLNKTADKLFGGKKPEEPTEPAFVTEAKLRWNLTNWKPGPSSQEQQEQQGKQSDSGRPKRADRWGSKQQSSKQRLAELVDAHKNKSAAAPQQQQARR